MDVIHIGHNIGLVTLPTMLVHIYCWNSHLSVYIRWEQRVTQEVDILGKYNGYATHKKELFEISILSMMIYFIVF